MILRDMVLAKLADEGAPAVATRAVEDCRGEGWFAATRRVLADDVRRIAIQTNTARNFASQRGGAHIGLIP